MSPMPTIVMLMVSSWAQGTSPRELGLCCWCHALGFCLEGVIHEVVGDG